MARFDVRVHKTCVELRDGQSWCPEAEAAEEQLGPEGDSDAVHAAADSTDPKLDPKRQR